MKLDDFSAQEQWTLKSLIRVQGAIEYRCPFCTTFHKNSCRWDHDLYRIIRTLDPELFEEIREATKGEV